MCFSLCTYRGEEVNELLNMYVQRGTSLLPIKNRSGPQPRISLTYRVPSFPLVSVRATLDVFPAHKSTFFGSSFSFYSTMDDSNVLSPPDFLLTHTIALPVFSYHKVQRPPHSLETNKAYEQNGIPPCVLNEQARELVPPPLRCCRLTFSTSNLLSSCKHVLGQLIPKREAILILQTIFLQLRLLLYQKSWNRLTVYILSSTLNIKVF